LLRRDRFDKTPSSEATEGSPALPAGASPFLTARVYRPQRRDGAIAPAVLSGLSFALALALAIRGALRGVTFAAFGGDLIALLLLVLAAVFAYWSYCVYTLRYLVDDDALVVIWGLVRNVIPVDQIDRIVLGRRFRTPRISGITWPGCQVGRGYVDSLGQVLFYSTHRAPADLVYVITREATFGLSLADARGMARAIQTAQEHPRRTDRPSVIYGALPLQALLRDRRVLILGGAALIAFLIGVGYLASRYKGLPLNVAFSYPPTDGPQRIGKRTELARLPLTAFLWLLAGFALAAWSHSRLRAVAYSLLAGTLFAECLYALASIAAAH
jgi:hypothetical protein